MTTGLLIFTTFCIIQWGYGIRSLFMEFDRLDSARKVALNKTFSATSSATSIN